MYSKITYLILPTGIKNKLTYLQDLGVDAIWLSPIYKSPMYDFGYDIEDYKSISPDYGTMEDFDALMVEAKRLGEFSLICNWVISSDNSLFT